MNNGGAHADYSAYLEYDKKTGWQYSGEVERDADSSDAVAHPVPFSRGCGVAIIAIMDRYGGRARVKPRRAPAKMNPGLDGE